MATLLRLAARLARWAESAPENFGHLHLLAAAEVARVSGRPGDAMEHYEAAIDAAGQQASPRHRALATSCTVASGWVAGSPALRPISWPRLASGTSRGVPRPR